MASGKASRLAVPTLLGFVLTASGSPPPRQSGDVARLWEAAHVLYVRAAEQDAWRAVCTATAFQQEGGGTYLLSADHCVHGRLLGVGKELNGPAIWPAQLTAFDERSDLAVLYVPGYSTQTVPVGKNVAVGETVLAVTFPWVWRKLLVQGTVSAESTVGMEAAVQISGMDSGSSGGAIYCVEQRAICAVVVGYWYNTPGYASVVPITELQGLNWRRTAPSSYKEN